MQGENLLAGGFIDVSFTLYQAKKHRLDTPAASR